MPNCASAELMSRRIVLQILAMGVRYSQSRNPQPIRSRSRNIEAAIANYGRITKGKGRFWECKRLKIIRGTALRYSTHSSPPKEL